MNPMDYEKMAARAEMICPAMMVTLAHAKSILVVPPMKGLPPIPLTGDQMSMYTTYLMALGRSQISGKPLREEIIELLKAMDHKQPGDSGLGLDKVAESFSSTLDAFQMATGLLPPSDNIKPENN